MTLENIVQILFNPTFTGWFLFIKIIFLLTILFFLALIIYVLVTTSWIRRMIIWDLREFSTYRHFGLVGTEKKWAKIKERFKIGLEAETKLAIIETDSFLDENLGAMGYRGENLDEKLDRLTADIISNLGEVKEAHQTCSNIIHDPSYHLDIVEAKKLLDAYEKALIDLQAI